MVRILSLFLYLFPLVIRAQIPQGYYDPAAGLTGIQLQQALHDIIDDHVTVDYSNLYTYFAMTDMKTDSTVWDMYSDNPGGSPPYIYYYVPGDQCGNYAAEGDCFNREHAWPKSWFGGDIMPMYSDLFHLYPTDGWVNNKRGNLPYGTVGTAGWTSLNGSKTGNCSWSGYAGVVFEPIDAYKGDFARSFFYMAVRYYGEDSGWPGSDMTTGSQLKPWAASMLLQWSQDDTVSPKEIDRNNDVYQVQQNRNPFIDHPQYALDIWGPGAAVTEKEYCTLLLYPNPVKDRCRIVFPEVLSGEKAWVLLYSTDGALRKAVQKPDDHAVNIDMQGFQPGVYIIRLTCECGKTAAPEKLVLIP
jgi:endonuclease I